MCSLAALTSLEFDSTTASSSAGVSHVSAPIPAAMRVFSGSEDPPRPMAVNPSPLDCH